MFQSAQTRITRGHSCLLCRQKKVRCDGQQPCSTCVKNGDQCRAGPPNRRRINSPPASDRILQRLRCYEEALEANGIEVDDGHPRAPRPVQRDPSTSSPEGHMIIKSGSSQYVEKYDPWPRRMVWTALLMSLPLLSSLWRGLKGEVIMPSF